MIWIKTKYITSCIKNCATHYIWCAYRFYLIFNSCTAIQDKATKRGASVRPEQFPKWYCEHLPRWIGIMSNQSYESFCFPNDITDDLMYLYGWNNVSWPTWTVQQSDTSGFIVCKLSTTYNHYLHIRSNVLITAKS